MLSLFICCRYNIFRDYAILTLSSRFFDPMQGLVLHTFFIFHGREHCEEECVNWREMMSIKRWVELAGNLFLINSTFPPPCDEMLTIQDLFGFTFIIWRNLFPKARCVVRTSPVCNCRQPLHNQLTPWRRYFFASKAYLAQNTANPCPKHPRSTNLINSGSIFHLLGSLSVHRT
jgi:hypothetical protein